MKKWSKLLIVPMVLSLALPSTFVMAEESSEAEVVVLSPEEALEFEDINAQGEAAKGTTIVDVDMTAEDWVDQAAAATDAVEGETFVRLSNGVLTVDQLNAFLKANPFELTYADDNNQFLYYNYKLEAEEMLGARRPDQVGSSLADVHPESAFQNLAWVINQLREGHTDHIRMAVPNADPEKFVVHDYYGIYDDEGNFMGINEVIWDIQPVVDFWMEQNSATYEVDATSGATEEVESEEEVIEDSAEESVDASVEDDSSEEESVEETEAESAEDESSEESSEEAAGSAAPALSPEEALEAEDIHAEGESAHGTTIPEVDMAADDWVDHASQATEAVEGDTYVKLDNGVLTVDQIDEFLKAQPVELTYADDNNQFLFYNYHTEAEDMLGSRQPEQVGSSLADVHPESAFQNLAWVINQLREGHTDHVRMAVPNSDPEKFVVHDYYGIYDEEGNYMGINEVIWDIQPVVDFWIEQTGAEVDMEETDVTSGATEEASEDDVEGEEAATDEESTDEVAVDFSNLEDGTYTGSTQGHNGPLEVEVVVEGGVITAVTVLDHSESAGLADPALNDIPAAIVENNSTDVEVVSGASVTSQAIIDAVNNALAQ